MEKSPLNIKSFRNLLSTQKSHKITPNNYQPTEIKINGLSGTTIIDESTEFACSIDDIYSLKPNAKCDGENNSLDCNKRNLIDIVCGNFVKFVDNYKSCGSLCLPVLTPVACSISIIICIAAIAGPLWLSTEEKIPYFAENSSFYRSNASVSYIIKSSTASLWIICTKQALDDNRSKLDFTYKNCSRIDFFAVEKYQPDTRDSTDESTNVIPYTITLSAPLLIISFIILLISYLLFLLAICSQKYKIFYFVAGIGFIISGLLMLSGLIMFISIFKSEVYHKLRPASIKEPLFSFNYGHSFMLFVIGFTFVKLSGILNICLFNRLQRTVQFNQNHFQLNNYVKTKQTNELSNSIYQQQQQQQHQRHEPFGMKSVPILENGFLPQKRRCSLHTISSTSNNNKKLDGFHSQQVSNIPPPPLFSEFNNTRYQTNQPFTRNVSTSTLDLDNQKDCGVSESAMKNNHRRVTEIKISKDKSNVGGNKMDFCGMMKSSKESPSVVNRMAKLRPAKNVYYIEDDTKDADTNIFIIEPHTTDRHQKFQHMRKSLEDIRLHKMPEIIGQCNGHDAWNFMERNRNSGSRTLPRDFAIRRNLRPSLDNLMDNFCQQHQTTAGGCERSDAQKRFNQNSNNSSYHPSQFLHHISFDELSTSKLNRNLHCPNGGTVDPQQPSVGHHEQPSSYQWPKVIPKSPSSFSVNSLRLKPRQPPPFANCHDYNPIEEFNLDKIEWEARKSYGDLFRRNVQVQNQNVPNDFGTAV